MAEDASIRMTVDSSQAESGNQKYVRAATETFNVLLRQSQQLGVSEKERIKWMEHEVELMKERNRLNTSETVNRLYEDPKLSGKQRAGLIRETRAEGREDIEELKQVNKNIKQLSTDQKVAEQKAERLGQSFTRMLPGLAGANSAEGMLSGGMSGLTATLGIAGILGGILISKTIRGAATMEPAMRDYAILTGRTLTDTQGEVGKLDISDKTGISSIGLTPSQYYARQAQLLHAGGGVVNESMFGIMATEKARGVSLAGVMGAERYGSGTSTNILNFFDRYLGTITKSVEQQRAMMPEMLQMFATEGTRMMRITGKVDSAAIAASMTTVGKAYGLTGEPLQLVYGTLQQGLQQSSNPQIQAMQYAAAEKALGPGASLLQMQMLMENPMKNPKYMVETMRQLRKMTGGGDAFTRAIFNYGLAPSLTIAQDMAGRPITEDMFAKEQAEFKRTSVGGHVKEAGGITGALEKATAAWAGKFEKAGFAGGTEELVTALTTALDGIGGTLNKISDKIDTWYGDQIVNSAKSHTNLGRAYNDWLLNLPSRLMSLTRAGL